MMFTQSTKANKPSSKFSMCTSNNTYGDRQIEDGDDSMLYNTDINIYAKRKLSDYADVIEKHSSEHISVERADHGLCIHTELAVPLRIITDSVMSFTRIVPRTDVLYTNGHELASAILSDMIHADNNKPKKADIDIVASPQSYPVFKNILENNGLDVVSSDIASSGSTVQVFKFGTMYKNKIRINIVYSLETRVLTISIFKLNYNISHHDITSFEQFDNAISQIGWAFI